MNRFMIYGKLPSLNDYTKACRTNKYKGNSMKQNCEDLIYFSILRAKLKKVINYPITLKITWYEENRKRDIDNICFATKFIHDDLVKA